MKQSGYNVTSLLQDIKDRKQQYIQAGLIGDVIALSLSFEFSMYNKTLQHELYLKLDRI